MDVYKLSTSGQYYNCGFNSLALYLAYTMRGENGERASSIIKNLFLTNEKYHQLLFYVYEAAGVAHDLFGLTVSSKDRAQAFCQWLETNSDPVLWQNLLGGPLRRFAAALYDTNMRAQETWSIERWPLLQAISFYCFEKEKSPETRRLRHNLKISTQYVECDQTLFEALAELEFSPLLIQELKSLWFGHPYTFEDLANFRDQELAQHIDLGSDALLKLNCDSVERFWHEMAWPSYIHYISEQANETFSSHDILNVLSESLQIKTYVVSRDYQKTYEQDPNYCLHHYIYHEHHHWSLLTRNAALRDLHELYLARSQGQIQSFKTSYLSLLANVLTSPKKSTVDASAPQPKKPLLRLHWSWRTHKEKPMPADEPELNVSLRLEP